MNKKRIVALLAAATMLISTVPVFATESTASSTEVTGGSTIVTGDATVNDVDKNKPLKVTLPTGNVLKFTVDPHNLVGLTTGQAMAIDLSATGQGAIVAPTDALAVIKNMSNVAVKVDATFNLVASGTSVNLVTDQSLVATGDATNMFLAVVPGTTKAWDDATYVTTNQAIAVENAGTKVSYKLKEAVWETIVTGGALKYQYDEDTENNFDAVAFKMGGSVNKAADWSPLVNNLTFTVVFDVAKAADTVEWAENTVVYDLVSGSAATTDYTPVVGAASGNMVDAVASYNDNLQSFALGKTASEGFGEGATVTSVKIEGVDCTAKANTAGGWIAVKWSDYTALGGEVTDDAEYEIIAVVNGVTYKGTYVK